MKETLAERVQKDPSIDYQVKRDEIVKEILFLQQYSPVGEEKEEDDLL